MNVSLRKREYVVVSVGGSLIVPGELDTAFLTTFRSLILRKVQEGLSFFIITGGGKLARKYQDTAREVKKDLSETDADWIGIHATRLNAHLFQNLFSPHARDRIVKDPTKALNARTPIIIGSGWKPGNSTDYCAVMAAKKVGAKKVVNLSNIDYVYDSDPRTNPDAKKLENLSWKEFRNIIPEKWNPGLSSPFDPVAAKEAEKLHLELACINGAKLEEFEKYLAHEPFIGTKIQ